MTLRLIEQVPVDLTTGHDNYQHDQSMRTGWGFGCVVKAANKTLLFDTGGDSETLLYNMGKAGIGPKGIDIVFLSHIHGDHVGGGFQLGGASDTELSSIVQGFRGLGVEKAAPCHCSGDRARELFKEEFKDDYVNNGVGKVIRIG